VQESKWAWARSATLNSPQASALSGAVENEHERIVHGMFNVCLARLGDSDGMGVKRANNLLPQSLYGGGNSTDIWA